MTTDLGSTLTVDADTADMYRYSIDNGSEKLTVVLNRKSTVLAFTAAASSKDLITGASGTMFNVPAFGAIILTNN